MDGKRRARDKYNVDVDYADADADDVDVADDGDSVVESKIIKFIN